MIYNRFSYKLYEGKRKLRINRIGSLMLIKYKSFGFDKDDDGDFHIENSFCFILSQLQLVEVMQHVVV